jgi:hypothetical protein
MKQSRIYCKGSKLSKFYKRNFILSDLYNATINIWGEISCHRHFNKVFLLINIFLFQTPYPLQSTPYMQSPIPPVPQNVTMAQAHAQAMYTAMMNQRMAFPQPFPRTPPSQPAHFPRPVYHSDPGTLVVVFKPGSHWQ